MIYVTLLGGLGNCLFQIANGMSLSLDNGVNVYFSLKTSSNRKNYYDSIFRNLPRIEEPKGRVLKEKYFTYHKIKYYHGIKLYGYYQSEKYFINHKEHIINYLKEYMHEIKTDLDEYFKIINNEHTISLHVRRTDYLKKKKYHYNQNDCYYRNAVDRLIEKLNINYETFKIKYTLVIFSDDIEWCRTWKFLIDYNCHYVDKNNDVFELYAMSLCKHNIITNSSFSWWGAYLNNYMDKIVIAPSIWFGKKGAKKWDTIYPDNWLIVSST